MANNTWLGRAAPVVQIDTVTLSGGDGDWAQNDTLNLTINGKSLTLTVGSTSTRAQIVLDLVDMWNGDALNGDESRNTTGDQLPEFNEITAAVGSSAHILQLTHDTAGVPFTLTTSETTAGAGALTEATSQAATGPNDVNNANNWSNAAVPANSDDVFIENTDVSLLYNLGALSSVTLTSLTVDQTFLGDIGLPNTNPNGYTEYRPEYFAISATTVTVGRGGGTGSGRIKLNTGSNATAITVHNTGAAAEFGLGAFIWKGTHANNTLNATGGTIDVAPFGGESATIATLTIDSNASVRLGNATLTTVSAAGGSILEFETGATTLNIDGATVTIIGSGAYTTVNHSFGVLNYRSSGTITTLNLGGVPGGEAEFNCSGDSRSRTITNFNQNANTRVVDPANTITYTNGIVVGSDVSEVIAS